MTGWLYLLGAAAIAATPPIEHQTTFTDMAAWPIAGLIVAGVIYIVIKVLGGVDKIEVAAEIEEKQFRQQMEEVASITGDQPAADLPPAPAHAVAGDAPRSHSGAHALNSPASDVEELARKLFALRIVTDCEGRLPLSLPPEGLIYRLRRGGVCAVIPRMESQDVMQHFCKRFDMVFVLTSDGDVIILERLQQRVASLIEEDRKRGIT